MILIIVPYSRGNSANINLFLDARHAENIVTRKSHYRFLIFIGKVLIICYSKNNNTIGSASFGAEFVALRDTTEANVALQYKIKMMGLEIEGETNIFSDNQSVVLNTQLPESMFKKRHNHIAYHDIIWEAVANDSRVCFERVNCNKADLLTNNPDKAKHELMSRCIMW